MQLRAQSRFLLLIIIGWLTVFFLTRSALWLTHFAQADAGVMDIVKIFLSGLVYDLTFLLYALLPMLLLFIVVPARWWQRAIWRYVLYGLTTFSLFVMLFTAVAEWLFWDEFSVRFNFIAVDYLVYSKEVINNILQSYPVYPLLAVLLAVAVLLCLGLRGQIRAVLQAPAAGWRFSGVLFASAGVVATGCALVISQHFPLQEGGNAYQRELAANGPYQFFAAFRNNELDYAQFYATLPQSQVLQQIRAELGTSGHLLQTVNTDGIRRYIRHSGEERRLNVVLVTIESLSAKYLGRFGDTRGLTPNLDSLYAESLVFDRFYATGTRTDRGLEAITLSVPPTPGRSIVKRIGRESGYASLGQQLSAKGYDSVFVYGGRGYFDNMNSFFGGNGYRIVDQSSVSDNDIQFSNAWGMSDEDLYTQALKIADADHAAGKPFLLQLMTTSNHRPYTYPDGRIDIPSGDGREGAVKYTDYAIGQFLAQARTRPWFHHTLFVFVADHTAGSAGKQDLPVAAYHIPLFIYAPDIVRPAVNSVLASQIDLAPTLLGLLNMDYESTFFGRDVLDDVITPGRVLIGNYQHLGLYDGQDLVILSPQKIIRRHQDALGDSREVMADISDADVQRAIAYYQYASYGFTHGLLAWRPQQGMPMLSQRKAYDVY